MSVALRATGPTARDESFRAPSPCWQPRQQRALMCWCRGSYVALIAVDTELWQKADNE